VVTAGVMGSFTEDDKVLARVEADVRPEDAVGRCSNDPAPR
jgi:hypothetical protein